MARFTDQSVFNISTSVQEVTFQTEGGTIGGTQPEFGGVYPFTASYIKVGNFVNFNILVDFTNIQSFGTGQYYLALPFPSKYSRMFREGCLHDDDVNRVYHISGEVEAGSSNMLLYTTDVQFSTRIYDFPFSYNEPIALTNADSFHIAGSYMAID